MAHTSDSLPAWLSGVGSAGGALGVVWGFVSARKRRLAHRVARLPVDEAKVAIEGFEGLASALQRELARREDREVALTRELAALRTEVLALRAEIGALRGLLAAHGIPLPPAA